MSIILKVIDGDMKGKEFKFDQPDIFLFGREKECHYCLPEDNYVSRHHFILEVNPPECQIKDLGSLNGTWVNGVKYGGRSKEQQPDAKKAEKDAKPVELKDGDEIKVGHTSMKVSVVKEKEIKPSPPPKPQAQKPKPDPAPVDDEIMDLILQDLILQMFPPQTPPANVPKIPNYEIIKELGEGGFGKVYLVKRMKDGKRFALKVMLPKKKQISQKDIDYFKREMESCAKMKHPNIVAFGDKGYEKGMFYFTMEFCGGGSIQNLLYSRGRNVSVSEAIPYMLQVLDGLDYIHRNNFVHRDLKPDNILLDETMKIAKIADLGLAKSYKDAGLSGFTGIGSYAGTYPYMPAEQYTNFRDVKPYTDVFSIGATFYHMLTGTYVYDFPAGADPISVILRGKVVPIRNRRKDILKGVADVIDKAISPNPGNRYKDAGEMKKALEKSI